MKKNNNPALILVLTGIAGLIPLVLLLVIPRDPKNVVFLGFSLQRLLMVIVALLLTSLPLLGAGLTIFGRPSVKELISKKILLFLNNRIVHFVSIFGIVFGWLGLFLPSYWFKRSHWYFERLSPFLIWAGVVGLILFVWITISRNGWHGRQWFVLQKEQSRLWTAIGICLVVFLIGGGLIWTTKIGIEPDMFWNGAGVPVLSFQVIIGLFLAFLLGGWLRKNSTGLARNRWVDGAVAAIIWLTAVLLWNFTPIDHSYHAPGPYPPNYEYYPFSDAVLYDLGGQYWQMGEGILKGIPLDKPVYMLMLGVFHLLGGQDYLNVIFIQLMVFAMLPVVLYRMGNEFGNREAGIFIALLAIFRERNALAAAQYIEVAPVKVMLTEFPAALGMIAAAYFIFRWLRNPNERNINAILAGGLIGVAAFIRPHALVMIPLIVGFAGFLFLPKWRIWLRSSGWFVITALVFMLPWLIVSQQANQGSLLTKIELIIQNRYFQKDTLILPDSHNAQATNPLISYKVEPMVIPLDLNVSDSNNWPRQDGNYESAVQFVPAHFAHNIIMSVLALPTSFRLDRIDLAVQSVFWRSIMSWDGGLSSGQTLLFILNLVILSIGIGKSWQKHRWAGLVPLIVFLGFYFANGLARTSGGRYLVPVDWVVLLYYGLGLVQIVQWGKTILGFMEKDGIFLEPKRDSLNQHQSGWKSELMAFGAFIILGLAVPYSHLLIPKHFEPLDRQALIQSTALQSALSVAGISQSDLDTFLTNPQAMLVLGRGLYPRYLNQYEGDIGAFQNLGYPRLYINLVSKDTSRNVLIPLQASPLHFENGIDYLVLGCWDEVDQMIDAVMITALDGTTEPILRDFQTELSCPLKRPVCDNNGNCN